ncbi:MAG TPA: hypothetical protein VG889_03700 [Rhizomicrobium sp.]|nr:hypothetical protein [Rhizomicrobium sp.]
MEHRYPTGEIMRLRDRVRGPDGLTGVVVGIIENDEYDLSVVSGKGWKDDCTGILVKTDAFGLVLYGEPDRIALFVLLAAAPA